MLKIVVVFVLLIITSCGGADCTEPTVRALKLIDSTVSSGGPVEKGKYTALVADARAKLDEMQKCLPREELIGERNEHLRNALIHYDEALDVWGSGPNAQTRQYWEMARGELSKVK